MCVFSLCNKLAWMPVHSDGSTTDAVDLTIGMKMRMWPGAPMLLACILRLVLLALYRTNGTVPARFFKGLRKATVSSVVPERAQGPRGPSTSTPPTHTCVLKLLHCRTDPNLRLVLASAPVGDDDSVSDLRDLPVDFLRILLCTWIKWISLFLIALRTWH